MELYFFKNVLNYDELKEKTINAYRIKSVCKRETIIIRTIEMKESNANCFFENIMADNQYVIDNLEMMKKENGVWYCIELFFGDKSMVVMADGYPYARFVAIKKID